MISVKKQEEINAHYQLTNFDTELHVQRQIISKTLVASKLIETATTNTIQERGGLDLLDLLFLIALMRQIEMIVNQMYAEITVIMMDALHNAILFNYGLPFILAGASVDKMSTEIINAMMINEHIGLPISSQIQNSKRTLLRNVYNSIYEGALSNKTGTQIGVQNARLLYNKNIQNVGGEAGRLIRIHRTENTRVRSHAKLHGIEQLQKRNFKVTREWVYTYESKVPRQHHLESTGQKADERGYFTINGLTTEGPGLFGLPEEDINCRCSTKIIVGPKL